jgi:hypothetical protein
MVGLSCPPDSGRFAQVIVDAMQDKKIAVK